MSLLDSLLGGQLDLAGIAAQAGVDPAMAQTALAALGQAQGQEGDAVANAAAQTGLDPAMLNQVVAALGGHEGLAQVAALVQSNPQILSGLNSFLDKDGDGSAVNDLLGMAKGLFGR